jgi:flagellar basal body-associated protein FliL
MGRSVAVALLAVVGLLCAAGMGYAAYMVSRGSVAVPVTRLQPSPQDLTPARVRAKRSRPGTTTARATTLRTTTVDDHGGNRGRGGGSGSSGHGGGGRGDD